MKREEAIEILKKWKENAGYVTDKNIGYIEGWWHKEDEEALQMAIQALEQEPCEDAISIEDLSREKEQSYMKGYEDGKKAIEQLLKLAKYGKFIKHGDTNHE